MSLDIFRAGLNSILTKTLGMKPGGESPAPILTPEINAGITLESDRPEYHFLAGAHIVGVQVTDQASEGYAWLEIRNPANSGVLCIIEEMYASWEGNQMCCLAGILPNPAAQLAAGVQQGTWPMDARWYLPWTAAFGGANVYQHPIIATYQEAAALTPGAFIQYVDHDNAGADIKNVRLLSREYPIILGPNQQAALIMQNGTPDDDARECGAKFRVRQLMPNELVAG